MYEKGFTVIELLAVITIISILIIVSPFSRSLYRSIETFIVINKIMTDLRWVRYQAVFNNKDYKVRFYSKDELFKKDDDKESEYIVYDDNSKEVIKEGKFPGYLILYKNLSQKKINSKYYERIKFNGEGTASHGTVGFGLGNKVYKIVVSRLGRVRVE